METLPLRLRRCALVFCCLSLGLSLPAQTYDTLYKSSYESTSTNSLTRLKEPIVTTPAASLVAANAGSAFDDFSVIFGHVSPTNYYFASFNESNDPATNGLFYYNGTTATQVVDFTTLITPGTTYTVKVEYIGSTLKVYRGPVGGSLTLYATYTVSLPASGKIGVGSKNDSATFDNALVP